METTINQRLMSIMEHYSLNPHSMASKLNTSDTNIRNYVIHKRSPSYEILFQVIQTFVEVNPEWLLTGIGQMKREKYQKRFIEERIDDIENQIKLLLSKNIEPQFKGQQLKETKSKAKKT